MSLIFLIYDILSQTWQEYVFTKKRKLMENNWSDAS